MTDRAGGPKLQKEESLTVEAVCATLRRLLTRQGEPKLFGNFHVEIRWGRPVETSFKKTARGDDELKYL